MTNGLRLTALYKFALYCIVLYDLPPVLSVCLCLSVCVVRSLCTLEWQWMTSYNTMHVSSSVITHR